MEYYESGGGRGRPPENSAPRRPGSRGPLPGAVSGTCPTVRTSTDHTEWAPDLERDDETLDFDWDDGSPGAGIDSNRFVARWTKTV